MTAPRLLVCAPLRLEALALQPRLPPGSVRRTGYGRRSLAWARRASGSGTMTGVHALAVAGLGMGTGIDLAPGDVVVATAVVDLTVPAAPPVPCTCPDVLVGALTAALTSAGGKVRVRAGRVATAGHLVGEAEAYRLGAAGVLAVDLESAYVATLAGERPLAVVRVVVDTPAAPLTRPDVVLRGPVALVRLAAVGTALAQWAEALPPPAPASSAAPKETPR